MKRSLLGLSSAMKRSFLSFAVLCLVLSAFGGNVLAVPIAVDQYQDMENGTAGNVLSAGIMTTSSHGSGSWTAPGGSMWVSTLYHRDLPGPVIVSGTTYNGTGGSRSWVFNNNNQQNFVRWNSPGYTEITVACFYTTLTTLTYTVGYDTINMWGGSYSCMQTLGVSSAGNQWGPLIRQHSCLAGNLTCASGGSIYLTPGKTYWVNMKYDAQVGLVMLAAFDPDNSYAQSGATIYAESAYGQSQGGSSDFGRLDGHGNTTNDTTQSYFDHIMFDYTNAAFPLLLCGPNDSTAPTAPPVVRDGTGHDQDQTIALSGTQLSANWDTAWDAQSGIKGYQYAIGTTKGGTDVVNWTTQKCQLGVTRTGLTLTNGQTYYFAVRAINGVGLTGPITNSGGQTYGPTDTTPPTAPTAVRDGWYIQGTPDCDYGAATFANYDPASDPESGISFYQYAIGTTPGGNDSVNWTYAPGNSREVFNATIPSPVGGTRYYTSVRAVNNVGLTGPAMSSDGVVYPVGTDSTNPGAPTAVRDGTGADIATQTSTTQLSANWDKGSDPDSGIMCYYYRIGTTPGGNNILNDTVSNINYYPVTNMTATGLSLSVGQTYYIGVKSINSKWMSSSWTNSNGVTIVSGGNQPPSAPANVRDGTGADITYTTSNAQLSANWDASTDSDGSVTAYQYAIGTSAGGTQTLNWTTLGNVTTVTKTGLSLTNGQTYYFSVKAVDNQGLAGNATNSNGQTVDTTAPSAPANVRDGVGADISTTSSTTQLSANWDASADAESGIAGYQYAIGTTAGGTQTVNWTSLGNVTTVTKTGLTLSVGQTYYFSVKAVNGAGLTGSATNSNGQTVVTGGSSVTYFHDNFESWTVHGGAWSSVNGESSTHTLNTSVDYAKAGAKCLKITDSDTTATSGASLTKNFSPVISTDIYIRFFIFLPTGYGSANSTCARRILRVYTNTSNYTVITLTGDGLAVSEVGGWSGTAQTFISENAWHCVELHVAPPSASTPIQYWIDGTSAGTCTGAFSGSSTFNYIQLGDVVLASGTTNSTGTIYWDELVVSNSYIGTGITAPVTYFSDNLESWTVHGGAWSSVSGETATQTLNTSTDYAKAGTKSLKLTDTDSTATWNACLVKNFSPVISGDIYVRFYLYLPTGYTSANTGIGVARRVLHIYCAGNRGQLSLANGAYPLMEEIGAWGTVQGPSSLSENTWHCIEMHITTPTATTVLEFWVDGVLNSTALMANFSASSSFDRIFLGDVSQNNAIGTGTFYMDEALVSNSYIGPLP